MLIRASRFLAICAVLTGGICTTVMNWRFSYQLGTNQIDAYVWGTFSVALDVCKWTMLGFAALSWRTHHLRALSAIAIWVVATLYSFAAALGFSATSRDATIADRRSQTELAATVNTMKQSPRWHSSAACSDATTKSSKDFCAIYRATSERLKGPPQQEDPQSALIAGLAGLSEDQARLALAIFLSIACELLSALGLFAVFSPTPARREPSKLITTEHAQIPTPQKAISPNPDAPRWRPRQT